MLDFFIEQAMHLKMEPIGFTNNRPSGFDSWTFIHFINPADIYILDTLHHVAHDACILIPPHTAVNYSSTSVYSLYHNYVHFSSTDSSFYETYGLPVNQLFYTNISNVIIQYIESISWKLMAERKDLEGTNEEFEVTAANTFKKLLVLLRDNIKNQKYVTTITTPFKQLRTQIYQDPKNWNVQKMAKYLYLNRSHFSIKYHELFNVTPQQDLTLAILDIAEKLLTNSKMSISEIASECGFSSSEYFIRFFKKHRNISPGKYRKSL